ncbi:MAG: response regulator [Bacteroidales bacterium]|nr:response regulator [Bacteroidales bacterium]
MIKQFLIYIFLILVFPITVLSENQSVKFKRLSVSEGLSQSWVRCICQDNQGFMWFGTHDGLNKFDGYTFKIYKHTIRDNNSISNNTIHVIYKDSEGNLWIGTSYGLNLFNPENETFIRFPDIDNNYINDIVRDKDGLLYIATNQGIIVYNIDTKHERIYQIFDNTDNIRSLAIIYKIKIDPYQNIWIASSKGVYFFSKKEKNFIPLQANIPYRARSLAFGKKGQMFIGTENNGLIIHNYNPENPLNNKIIDLQNNRNSFSASNIGAMISLLADNHGTLWIGIENGGLDVIDISKQNSKEYISKHYHYDVFDNTSLSSNSIYSIFEDKDGNIWIGTYNKGINQYNRFGDNFIHFHKINQIAYNENNLSSNMVNLIYAKNNSLYIGTEGGLFIDNIKTNELKHLFHNPQNPNSLTSNSVWCIYFDENNKIWLGTWGGGINIYDPVNNAYLHYMNISTDDNSLGGNNIFSIYKDSKNYLWIGSMGGGLNLYNKQTNSFKKYKNDITNSLSISSDWVRAIAEDSYGNLWVSTSLAVDVFDREKEQFTHFTHIPGDPSTLSDYGAEVIFEDSKKNLWMGTENGLNLFHRKDSSFTYYLDEDGLPNNSIKAILEDNEGNLWLSTNNGLSKFMNAINIPEKPEFMNYDIGDGLQDDEFNRRAACKDNNGILYFGGINGVTYFNPENIIINQKKPEVVITNFLINNKPVPIGKKNFLLKKHISQTKKIKIPYRYSVISFEFACLNFISPEKNQYAYYLEGFEETWNYVGNQRTVTYTNLNHGNYTLRIKASNNSGIWNEDGISLAITILPPWYNTWWAYAGYFIIIGFILLLFRESVLMRARFKHDLKMEQLEKEKLAEINQVKSNFFINLSHEFRTPLTLILHPVEQLLSAKKIKPELKKQFQMMQRNAKRLLRLINQLMDISKLESDYLKPEVQNGNIAERIEFIVSSFNYRACEKSISLKYNSSHNTFTGYYDQDKLEKILYNIISNALKFTPENGEIVVNVDYYQDIPENENGGYFKISVKDNGIGIEPAEINKIFDRFYQINNQKEKEQTGTGIGLSLVKGLVNIYHGKIDVKSQIDMGTEFTIILPWAERHFPKNEIIGEVNDYSENFDQEQKIDIQDNIPNNEIQQKNIILIIEDNKELNDVLTSHFTNKYRVYNCFSGTQGLEKAKEIMPDIIVSDVMMPGIDGIELCKILKNNELTSHIPIILLTSMTSEEDQVKGMETGADAYITKPFHLKLLNANIENLLDSRKKLRDLFSRSIDVKPSDISITSVDEKFLKKVIELVDKNISNPYFNVDQLSKEIGLSRAHLHRKLVSLTDLPPSGFIRIMRLKRAAKLLVEGQLQVSEVLYEVGIKSRSYFTKSFKEVFGLSPTEYIEKQNKKT